jgi:predicted enzyme related to lactoylglutathione lyase/quinol monooxygenase YgiN
MQEKLMSAAGAGAVSLTSHWFIRPDCEEQVMVAVQELAANVRANEPDTLTYLVHAPFMDKRLQSLPPSGSPFLLFFEVYRDADAFLRHVNGPVFKDFVDRYGSLFVQSDGKPFTTVKFLSQQAGFVREAPLAKSGESSVAVNQHPAVMFEIIGRDQRALQKFYSRVFGWQYQEGSSGFAYVHFPVRTLPLLGGIGQANPDIPGFDPGRNFYLLVDDLEAAIGRALAAGGTRYMEPASADGYTFAMIRDPEGNPVGLIKPFNESAT